MTTRDTTKVVVVALTELGAGYIVKELIKSNVATPTRIDKKIVFVVAMSALAGLVAAKAGSYMVRSIDEFFDNYEKVMKMLTK